MLPVEVGANSWLPLGQTVGFLHPRLPKPVAALGKSSSMILGSTFFVFELAATMMLFYLNWLGCRCFLAKK
jgi:hypothetical protein